MTLLAFSQGLDYVIQQLAQFANSLTPVTSVETHKGEDCIRVPNEAIIHNEGWLGYVCMPVKGGPAASGMPAPGAQTLWHVEALLDVAVSFEMLRCHMNYECISHHTRNAQSQSTFHNTPKAEIPGVARCAGVESLLLQPQPQTDPKVIMAPNANKKKAGTKVKVSTSKVQASPMSTSKTFFILDTIPWCIWLFRPIGMRYLAVFCHHIGVPLTAIWWHDKRWFDLSTSFASVHVLLSTFTSEADAISAGFNKAPAMFCNGSSPTKDVMSSQTVLDADTLCDFPEGVYVPSPLPPYFDHLFLPHKWRCWEQPPLQAVLHAVARIHVLLAPNLSTRRGEGIRRTSSVRATFAWSMSSSRGRVLLTLAGLRRCHFLMRASTVHRAPARAARASTAIRHTSSPPALATLSITCPRAPSLHHSQQPPLGGSTLSGGGAFMKGTRVKPRSGTGAMPSGNPQGRGRMRGDFGSQGEFSPASADMVVGENPKTLHQPLTWADRKGNTEPAPPTPLENPYMGVKDYDTWSNQCENEFLKDMDEYKVDPTTKPFPVVKRVEWATLFTNSCRLFQYTEQCPPKCKPDIYTRDHASIARHWDKYGAPHFYSTNYMRLPTMYSTQMPYIGYISRCIDDPPLPASLDMISSSDGVKLTNAYRKQLEDFVLRNREWYRQWCLPASNLGIQVSLATLVTPVKPQSLGESPFSVHLLSQSMPDELAMTQLASDYLRCAYEYGAFAQMTMHWCIDHISTVGKTDHPHFGVDDNLIRALYLHSNSGVWLDDLQVHGVPLWGLWFDDAGIDIKSMQHLTGKEISQEELDPILKEKGNNVHYHTVSEQLILFFFSPTFPHTSSISLAFPHASSISPAFLHMSSLPLTFPDTSAIPIAFSHTPTLSPHVPAHILGIPLSPKGENSIIPSPKRTIIIVKNAIILWVPHSLINGLIGTVWVCRLGVAPIQPSLHFRRGGSQPVHGLCPHALTTTFGPTCGHNDDWGSEFHASCGGELNRSSHSGTLTGPNATFSVSGPMQPISGWVGTTTSSAVAKGSHVDLMSSFQSIPLGRWFAIIAGPLPNDGFHDIQLWLDVYPQVIAIRDELKTLVSSWATPHGVDIGTTTVEEPSGPSERFTGWKDLEYVNQGAPPCIKGGAERARYGEFFLHYDTFPPLSGAAPPKAERLRHLDCVEFSTEWFLTRLAGLRDHVDLPLCRMEMLIHSHKYHSLGAGFAMPMWPTEGPVDAVICHIS
ncbi:hypothetical protein BS47DRAFT_1368656 [Hydnum rufescens UP504]|uniref:Uncharacterized protein n=1 Tax=Hydnum rufescens UP504 TaxID=1448309 RepID=A0A9P6AF66_9AGAM|nr:hypothetical protein BS47DRAFT_1368656 [Hydnum rufescens UP504]